MHMVLSLFYFPDNAKYPEAPNNADPPKRLMNFGLFEIVLVAFIADAA